MSSRSAPSAAWGPAKCHSYGFHKSCIAMLPRRTVYSLGWSGAVTDSSVTQLLVDSKYHPGPNREMCRGRAACLQ